MQVVGNADTKKPHFSSAAQTSDVRAGKVVKDDILGVSVDSVNKDCSAKRFPCFHSVPKDTSVKRFGLPSF